ncbi:MAG: DUF6323 family protein [Acutalibacteraceae bacterium]
MEFELDLFHPSGSLEKKKIDEILSLGEVTERYHIKMTPEKAKYIVDSSKSALYDTGRIEFGESAAKKITQKFCSSPYISKYNFEKTIGKLLEIFFYTKNETEDLIKDDELIDYMLKAFNTVCHGSVTLLYDWAINKLIHEVRFRGLPKDEDDEEVANVQNSALNIESEDSEDEQQ